MFVTNDSFSTKNRSDYMFNCGLIRLVQTSQILLRTLLAKTAGQNNSSFNMLNFAKLGRKYALIL